MSTTTTQAPVAFVPSTAPLTRDILHKSQASLPSNTESLSNLDSFRDRLRGANIPHRALVVRDGEHFECTKKELKALVDANPKHPLADAFRKAIAVLQDNDKVTVDKADLEAVMDNRKLVVINDTQIGPDGMSEIVQRKVLGEKL